MLMTFVWLLHQFYLFLTALYSSDHPLQKKWHGIPCKCNKLPGQFSRLWYQRKICQNISCVQTTMMDLLMMDLLSTDLKFILLGMPIDDFQLESYIFSWGVSWSWFLCLHLHSRYYLISALLLTHNTFHANFRDWESHQWELAMYSLHNRLYSYSVGGWRNPL